MVDKGGRQCPFSNNCPFFFFNKTSIDGKGLDCWVRFDFFFFFRKVKTCTKGDGRKGKKGIWIFFPVVELIVGSRIGKEKQINGGWGGGQNF